MGKTPFTEIKPTYEENRALETARVAFMIAAPFYAHLYHSIGKEVITRQHPTLATDGRHIVINPAYFLKLTTSERVFALAHEMSHLVCRHAQRAAYYAKAGEIRGKPVSHAFSNICMDYVINRDLIETGVGSCNPNWLLHPQVRGTDLWEEVYARLWEDPPPPPPGGGQPGKPCPEGQPGGNGTRVQPPTPPPGGGGNSCPEGQPGGNGTEVQQETPSSNEPKSGHETRRKRDQGRGAGMGKADPLAEAQDGAFDTLLPIPVDPVTGEVDLPSEPEFQEAVARALAVAKATTKGTIPASIQRLCDEILAPQVNWRDHIRMLVTGRIGARGETWKRPNRRRLALNPIMILPGKRGYGADTVVVGVDTSGSIGDKELAVFLTEVGGILSDVKPRRIIVIGCDADVSQVDELTTLDDFEGLKAKGVKGGGGTDFRPVFEYVTTHDLRPDALIYLTDLYGSFPKDAPVYPVFWAATTDDDPPFGEVVRIKME